MASGFRDSKKNILEGKTMAKASGELDINRLVEYLGGLLGDLIKSGIGFAGKKLAEKERLRKTAHAVFKAAAKEIYQNMAILGEQDYKVLKKYAINSPQIKNIVQSLETTFQEQLETCIEQYTQLKKKEKAEIIGKISLAQFKIDQMRRLTKKTKKELETLHHHYCPVVRLQNIRKVYLAINGLVQ
jgi:hypothetical protein